MNDKDCLKREIEKLKKENFILRNLFKKYNLGDIDELIKNFESEKKNNKRNSIYYDSKETINDNNINEKCLICDENTVFENKYCIKHKMELKYDEVKNINIIIFLNITIFCIFFI